MTDIRDTLIDKVAKAIFDAEFDFDDIIISPWPDDESIFSIAEMRTSDDFRRVARAAIAAMREPTRRMLNDGEATCFEHRATAEDWSLSITKETWQAMINAALAEAKAL
jgi:hypothetical protein